MIVPHTGCFQIHKLSTKCSFSTSKSRLGVPTSHVLVCLKASDSILHTKTKKSAGTHSFTVRYCMSSSLSLSNQPLRYAVLGAGFAGLSVAWNLLQHGSKQSHICVDIYDEVCVAGGASGISGGLLHPYSPKVKLLWRVQISGEKVKIF